jgi:prolyl oligopeptidase
MSPESISHLLAGEPAHDVLHGIKVDDPFRWLEDQESPATRAFIRTEQEIYREYLRNHSLLRASIEARVRELLTIETVDLPIPDRRGGLFYLKRWPEEEQKAIYHQDQSGAEKILISVAMLKRGSYTSLAILQVSRDGRYLVFGIRSGGEDVQEICIYDLAQRRILTDNLPRGFYRGLVFDTNGNGFFYVHEESSGTYRFRHSVRRHEFGGDQRDDREVFHAGDGPEMRLIVQGAEDDSALGYLIVSLKSVPQTRFLIQELPLNTAPREIVRFSGASFWPRFTASAIEATTTHEAPLGRMVRISNDRPDLEAWVDIIPEMGECLNSWERCGEWRVLHYTDGGRKLTRIYSESHELLRTIEYEPCGTTVIGHVDACSGQLFYANSNIDTPPAIHSVSLSTGVHRMWWHQPRTIGQRKCEIEELTYLSKDGTKVPVTLIHAQGVKGIRPVLLSAYGGGGVSTTPKFSVLLTILLEAGFTCVTAHVRGGGEGGLEWHLAGKKQRKQSATDDLICAAEWLIENRYTTPDHLGIAGQSNGATLALCALTQRPGLFRAALALGPLSDLSRFHLFGVARGFVAEWGSPEDPNEFAALYRLSPYHHVQQEANHPAVLIISGDRDKRCDSLHARKMTARLQEVAAEERPILLDYTDTWPDRCFVPVRLLV